MRLAPNTLKCLVEAYDGGRAMGDAEIMARVIPYFWSYVDCSRNCRLTDTVKLEVAIIRLPIS